MVKPKSDFSTVRKTTLLRIVTETGAHYVRYTVEIDAGDTAQMAPIRHARMARARGGEEERIMFINCLHLLEAR